MPKSVSPSINEAAFDCPHCGAYTTQFWRKIYSKPFEREYPTPTMPDDEIENALLQEKDLPEPQKRRMKEYFANIRSEKVFEDTSHNNVYNVIELGNIHVTRCYACGDFTVWVHDKIVHPPTRTGDAPNPDLPEDITRDYEEARSI